MDPSQKNGNAGVAQDSSQTSQDPFNLERTIRLYGPIDWEAATALTNALEEMASKSWRPIRLTITSPGGLIGCGFAVFDTINRLGVPVTTEILGCAYSAAALVAQAGTHRLIAPNGAIRIHEMREDLNGTVDLTQLRHIFDENRARQGRCERIFAERTGQPRRLVRSWCRQEKPFGAEEALKMRLVDDIIRPADRPRPALNA